MNKKHIPNKTEGFTLVEVLVVVTIISVLASIAAVSYSRFIKQSRDTRRKTDVEQIRAAIELYRNFKGAYPTPGMTFGSSSITDVVGGVTSTYLGKVPDDPMPTPYSYYYTSADPYQDYVLCAYIEGGETTSVNPAPSCGVTCNYCMGPYGQK